MLKISQCSYQRIHSDRFHDDGWFGSLSLSVLRARDPAGLPFFFWRREAVLEPPGGWCAAFLQALASPVRRARILGAPRTRVHCIEVSFGRLNICLVVRELGHLKVLQSRRAEPFSHAVIPVHPTRIKP